MSAVEDIRIKLETRLRVVEDEIESLRSALTALDDQEAAAVGPTESEAAAERSPEDARAKAPGPARRGRGRRAVASRSTEPEAPPAAASAELERLLAETGGINAVELARETGTDYGVVLARIRQLEQAGQGRR